MEEEHRINRRIRISPIRVIAPDGEQLGVMSADEGREHAAGYGFDLVEVAPQARPPVCRIMDYGKYRYDQSKRKSASKGARVVLKTLQFRPNTDEHDLENKLRNAERFLDQGNKVKLVLRMRGREQAYKSRWVDQMRAMIARIDAMIEEGIKITTLPTAEGRQITAVVESLA